MTWWRKSVIAIGAMIAIAAMIWPAGQAGATARSRVRPPDKVPVTNQGQAGKFKGFSVAISGDIAVAGVPGVGNWTGQAYVYQRSGRFWLHTATLSDPRKAKNDVFAWSVAVSSSKAGNYIVIGGNDGNGKRDYVYIYKGVGHTWHSQATLGDPGKTSQDMFGDAVAISGTTLVIGASCQNGFSGQAYVYTRFGKRWVMQASLADPAAKSQQDFGQSVAASGRTVVIGARNVAYVYHYSHGWQPTGTLRNPGKSTDAFGRSVAVAGGVALVGAPGPMPPQHKAKPGAAYIYALTGKKWSLKQTLPAPKGGDEFGFAVAIAGTDAMVGMPLYTHLGCGSAFGYASSAGHWVERTQLVDANCPAGANSAGQ